MALTSKSLFNYGFTVNALNSSIDFRAALAGPILQATLRFGYYSLTDMMNEFARAMGAVDPDNEYTLTADRTINGGLENRTTIVTDGTYLDLLFSTGPRTASNAASLLGFNVQDYTGALTYTGSSTSGTVLIPEFVGYNYLSPDYDSKYFGVKNVSASGKKETITFAKQEFVQVQFMYNSVTKIVTEWKDLFDWMNPQRPFEFTPEISNPSVFYNVTLERTESDGTNGMAQKFREHLPQFPFLYDTGMLTMRIEN